MDKLTQLLVSENAKTHKYYTLKEAYDICRKEVGMDDSDFIDQNGERHLIKKMDNWMFEYNGKQEDCRNYLNNNEKFQMLKKYFLNQRNKYVFIDIDSSGAIYDMDPSFHKTEKEKARPRIFGNFDYRISDKKFETTFSSEEYKIEVGTQEELEANWKYEIEDHWVKLKGYIGNDSDVKICGQYKINGKVYDTDIEKAFSSVKDNKENDRIKSITVGYGCSAQSAVGCFGWMYELNTIDIQGLNIIDGDADDMFCRCEKLQSVKLRNIKSIQSMDSMFAFCLNLTKLDLRGIKTDNLNWMAKAFDNCDNLEEIDMSTFDTTKVRSMGALFRDCPKLKTIYVGKNWKVLEVDSDMYQNCGTSTVTLKDE